MRRIQYRYAAIGAGNDIRYRPMVDVILLAPNGEAARISALADTGADYCLFPLDIAMLLQLNLARLPAATTIGVGNTANLTYYDTLTIDLGHGVIFETKVGFTKGMNSAGFGLLGQQGFFENFNVEFRHRERIFTVERS
jgi:hypothetical protein